MKLAVISDIHANDVALRTALHDAAQCGVDVCASLGDIVGYGPSPVESVHLAHDSFTVSVLGNHDAAVRGLRGISDFSDYAAEAVRVQRRQLGVVERTYLKLLPLVWNEGDVAMTHGDFTATGEDGAYRLERNYVPCVKGGRAGLYDAVSKTVYYSQGSTDFVAPSPANGVMGVAK